MDNHWIDSVSNINVVTSSEAPPVVNAFHWPGPIQKERMNYKN